MKLFKSSNPAINEKVFDTAIVMPGEELMSVQGTFRKFGLMLIMLFGAASFTWSLFYKGVNVMPIAMGSAIAGFIVALVIIFKRSWAPYLALGYALLQGLFLGAISAVFEAAFADKYPGIVMQAVLLTFGVALTLFALYNFRIIKPRIHSRRWS